MRITKILLTTAIVALATPVLADQANMDKAISAAFKSYHEGGIDGMYQDARLCTTGVDFESRTQSPAKQAEYCGAFEYTGFLILDHYGQLKDAGYFDSVGVLYRADANLERAGIINSPQQLNDYFASHFGYVRKKVRAQLPPPGVNMPEAADDSKASEQAKIEQYKQKVVLAAKKECDGDVGDGVVSNAFSVGPNSTAPTVIVARSNECAGGAGGGSWLWAFTRDGRAIQPVPGDTPRAPERVTFEGDKIIVQSVEYGDGDALNDPTHVTLITYKVAGSKLAKVSSRVIATTEH